MNRFIFLFLFGFPGMLFAQTFESFQAVVKTTNPQRVQREKKARVLVEHDMNNEINLNHSSFPQSRNSNIAHTTVSPSEGFILGTTDYDYGWNSGSRRTIVVNDAGTNVHMVWMERNLSLIPPRNKCTMKYGYYDWSLGTVITGYPEQNFISASGVGNVDVFWGGDADNVAALCGGPPIWFAIDSSSGAAHFIKTNVGAADESTGPAITIDNSNAGTIYLTYDDANRLNICIKKSTDYGSSWTDPSESMIITPPFVMGNIDNEIQVAPNGNLIIVTCLTGFGAVVPVGSVHPDSADCIGYYTSTDGGAHWTWTTLGHDGDKIVIDSDTLYIFFENFGSLDALVDHNNCLHIAVGMYAVKLINESTTANYFGTLYWKTGQTGWRLISRPEDMHIADFDSSYYRYSGNACGHQYPTLAADPNSNCVFVIWSQTRITHGKLDVAYNGISHYDLWYNFSINGGTSWSTAQKLANSDGGLFVSAAPKLTVIDGSTYRAHCIYIADTTAGCAVDGESAATQVPVVYRTIDFFHEGPIVDSSPRDEEHSGLPKYYNLLQNYPNPFNPTTVINYDLPVTSLVRLVVYDLLGREVTTLVNEKKHAGMYSVQWDASRMASGIYFYRLNTGSFSATKKLILMH